MSLDLIVMHMGALHPYEKVLTLLLAFGPFVVLGSVIGLRRRHESDDETAQTSQKHSADVHQSA
jgi:hypothetical protein